MRYDDQPPEPNPPPRQPGQFRGTNYIERLTRLEERADLHGALVAPLQHELRDLTARHSELMEKLLAHLEDNQRVHHRMDGCDKTLMAVRQDIAVIGEQIKAITEFRSKVMQGVFVVLAGLGAAMWFLIQHWVDSGKHG